MARLRLGDWVFEKGVSVFGPLTDVGKGARPSGVLFTPRANVTPSAWLQPGPSAPVL